MPKFKSINKKRKQLCTFCGKKFKRVQQHQQFCKAMKTTSSVNNSEGKQALESISRDMYKTGYDAAKKEFNERREEVRLTTIRSVAEAMTSLAHFVDNMNGLMLSGRN